MYFYFNFHLVINSCLCIRNIIENNKLSKNIHNIHIFIKVLIIKNLYEYEA